jgi:uncharacterized membrane protein YkvA (DUF1232 family)
MATSREVARPGWGEMLRLVVQLPALCRLHWRLFRDARVSMWPKAVLVLALVYVVVPTDLVPDVLPIVGEVDDLVVVLAAARLFIGLCPAAVVQEHATAVGIRRL